MKNEMPARMTIAPTAIAAIPEPLTDVPPDVVVVFAIVGTFVGVVGIVGWFWGSGPSGLPGPC
jgi:hypothetical protein